MRIAYILIHDIKKNDGITKKILAQKEQWEKEGNTVEVYTTMPSKGDSILDSNQYISISPFKLRFQLQKDLIRDIDNFNPDIIYFRYNTWSRTWSFLMNKYKSIVEINTYDLGEYKLLLKKEKTLKSFLRYIGYKFLRGMVLNKVNGVIGVTKEIIEHYDYRKYNKPTIYIPNGIDLNIYKTFKKNKNNNERIGVFFIGSPGAEWHGVEYIQKIAKDLPEYDFHIVGSEGINTKNLYWHGYLSKIDYLIILNKCNICIGSLALYKNKMEEACPLKVREYLAYGYPVILGYTDTAFIDKELPSWVLKIDTRKELELDRIKYFIENNKNKIIYHSDISYIDTSILEQDRLNFFKEINKI